MKNVTIVSHLTPREWRESFADKVVEDNDENKKKYQLTTCYWGHFDDPTHFTLCHHKEGEIKSMSIAQYFEGTIEQDERGTLVKGTFKKKKTANIFMGFGAVLCILAFFGSIANNDIEILATTAILFVILVALYFSAPKSVQNKILKMLKEVSFDEKYHKKRITANPEKLKRKQNKKITMKDKTTVITTEEYENGVDVIVDEAIIAAEAEGAVEEVVETVEDVAETVVEETVEEAEAAPETFAETVDIIKEAAAAEAEAEETAEEAVEEPEQVINMSEIINNLKMNK